MLGYPHKKHIEKNKEVQTQNKSYEDICPKSYDQDCCNPFSGLKKIIIIINKINSQKDQKNIRPKRLENGHKNWSRRLKIQRWIFDSILLKDESPV